MQMLGNLLYVASLVCWILVLVKVFQSGNTLMGVLSICPLVAFIYGWMKNQQLGIQKVMLVWTGIAVINIILTIVIISSMHA